MRIFCAWSSGISYQLEIGKCLLTFWLNAPVFVRTKVKKCEQFTIDFALMMTKNISKKVFQFQAGNKELLQAFVYSENCFQAFLDRWVLKYSTYVYICLPVSGIHYNRYTLALLLSQLWFEHECVDLD